LVKHLPTVPTASPWARGRRPLRGLRIPAPPPVCSQSCGTRSALGERVCRDGAFSSRRGTGEGLLASASHVVQSGLCFSYSFPLPVRSAHCCATQPNPKTRQGACCAGEGST
jgi:hypothetical protein